MATAFAVFCATDGSLTFYNRDTVPAVGDTFEGKVVSNVYTSFENGYYSSASIVPWYNNRTNIVSVAFIDVIIPKYTRNWFYGATAMTSFDDSNFDTSNVTNMNSMFNNCSNLININVSNFDTSNVTDIGSMFNCCSSLINIDVSNFNTSNVTNMSSMFSECSSLTSIDLSNFDTSKVTNMSNMFRKCSNLTNLNISNFDTSKTTNMGNMFSECSNLINLNVSSFNTSNVTSMSTMFYYCSNLTSLDLSSFDTSNVAYVGNMFDMCQKLATIYASERWSTIAITSSNGMFGACTSLVGAVPFDSTKTDASMANYETGYFTYKRYVKPEDMLIKNTTLYNIADEIRILYGTEDAMTPAVMNSNLNTFNTELSAINVEQDGLIEQLKNLFGAEFPEADTLDGCSWENISKVTEKGLASNFWSVGDTKKVVLNGTVGTLSLDNYETYVYIIGFDHNGATGTIDFGTFKTAASGGADIALIDNNYGNGIDDGTMVFNMNHWGDSNIGGWSGCDMRYDILGSTDIPPSGYGSIVASGRAGYDASSTCATNPVSNTLMAALPSELRNVMKPMSIYTDNIGGGTNIESNITITVDYLPLLTEFEILGKQRHANSYEQNYQTQYAYYVNGNSVVKLRHSEQNVGNAGYFTRSVKSNTVQSFTLGAGGVVGYYNSKVSQGLAPIFRV